MPVISTRFAVEFRRGVPVRRVRSGVEGRNGICRLGLTSRQVETGVSGCERAAVVGGAGDAHVVGRA